MADFDWEKESVPVPVPVHGEGNQPAFDWERDSVSTSPQGSGTDAALRGVGQGLTFNFLDEAAGALNAAVPALKKEPYELVADWLEGNKAPAKAGTYEEERDALRSLNAQAQKAHPAGYGGGELAGAVLGQAALPVGKGLGGAMAAGAGTGALAGAGLSEADTARGVAGDALVTGGLGAAGGAAGYGIGKAVGAIGGAARNWTQRGIDAAQASSDAIANRAAQKWVRSASGSLGGDAGGVLRIAEKAKEVLADPRATEALKQRAREVLEQPDVIAATHRAYENVLGRSGQKISEMLASEEAMQAALKAASPEAVQAASAESLAEPVKKHIWPQLRKQVIDRAGIPAAFGAVGAAVGDDDAKIGFGVGATVGGIVQGIVGGRPSSAFERMVNRPSVRKAGWEVLQKVLAETPERLGKWAPGLARALSQGPAAFAVHHFVLSHQDSEAREALRSAEEQSDH